MAQAKKDDALAATGTIEVNGVGLEVREAGSGRPLIVISAGDQAQIVPLVNGLAENNRVLAIDVSAAERAPASNVLNGLSRFGIERFSVIGISQGVPLALAIAIAAPDQIDKLIMMSPPPWSEIDDQLRAGLAAVGAPTLILVGTSDRSGSADSARKLRETIGASQLLLVYDAGALIAADRPDACASPIGEFLDHGVEFVVCHDSQKLRP
jgi:pimeloyl-ACP methyl ester carboxylesterase